MSKVDIKVKRDNPEGCIDEITVEGFGKPKKMYIRDDLNGIKELQRFLVKQQKKCSDLSEQIFDLMEEQLSLMQLYHYEPEESIISQGIKDVAKKILDNE